MMQRYCGNYWSISNAGKVMEILLESDVPVFYRHVWKDEVKNKTTCSRWMLAETIVDLHSCGQKPEDSSWLMKYDMEVSFDIPSDKYPLLMARQNEYEREFAEHFEKVKTRPVPEWAISTTECEQGYMYGNEIAPEREFFDSNLYDIHGELRGIV